MCIVLWQNVHSVFPRGAHFPSAWTHFLFCSYMWSLCLILFDPNSCLFSISFLCWPRNPVIQASCKSVPPTPAAIALNFTHLSCTILKFRSWIPWLWISLFFFFNIPQNHHQQVMFIRTICKEAHKFKFLTIKAWGTYRCHCTIPGLGIIKGMQKILNHTFISQHTKIHYQHTLIFNLNVCTVHHKSS